MFVLILENCCDLVSLTYCFFSDIRVHLCQQISLDTSDNISTSWEDQAFKLSSCSKLMTLFSDGNAGRFHIIKQMKRLNALISLNSDEKAGRFLMKRLNAFLK